MAGVYRIDRKNNMEKEVFPQFNLFPRIERAAKFIRSIIFNTNVPLHSSPHYVREHFTDEPVKPAGGLPPAKRFEE